MDKAVSTTNGQGGTAVVEPGKPAAKPAPLFETNQIWLAVYLCSKEKQLVSHRRVQAGSKEKVFFQFADVRGCNKLHEDFLLINPPIGIQDVIRYHTSLKALIYNGA